MISSQKLVGLILIIVTTPLSMMRLAPKRQWGAGLKLKNPTPTNHSGQRIAGSLTYMLK
jgi:hypothetical protein